MERLNSQIYNSKISWSPSSLGGGGRVRTPAHHSGSYKSESWLSLKQRAMSHLPVSKPTTIQWTLTTMRHNMAQGSLPLYLNLLFLRLLFWVAESSPNHAPPQHLMTHQKKNMSPAKYQQVFSLLVGKFRHFVHYLFHSNWHKEKNVRPLFKLI